MTIFEDLTTEIPPVSITRLDEDPEGQELLERLDDIHERKEEAQATIRVEGKPLSDLMAEADEMAARALVGDADPEAVEEAEAAVQETKDTIEAARREVRQCERAADLVREKLHTRSTELHEENAESVRAVHRVLLRRALEAERRAATFLRIVREFEARYARYTADDASVQHPQYLRERERTHPPRALMGPARTPGGNVFSRNEASTWMHRAADMLDEDPPAVLHLESLDFEVEDIDLAYGTMEAPLPPSPSSEAAPDATGDADDASTEEVPADDAPAPTEADEAPASSSADATPDDDTPDDEMDRGTDDEGADDASDDAAETDRVEAA